WACKMQPLSADDNTMSGLNVHGGLIDELHEHKTSGVVDMLTTATGARRQPMILEITTAGFDRHSICWEHHEYSRQVLEGAIEDDRWFTFIACAEEKEDWKDPAVWARANPNLGVSVKMESLVDEAHKAERMPSRQNVFKRLRLCQWTQQSDRWIDQALWDENAGEVGAQELEENLEGELCFGGLDLSSVSDLTAWAMVFPYPDDEEEIDVLARFWCPEARLTDDSNKYMGQYQTWAREGWLKTTPGDAVDYAFVKKCVLEDAEKFRLKDMNVDRLFQGYQLSAELADEGITLFGMGMGFMSFSAPMRDFERRLLKKKVHHGNNPILAWMVGGLSVAQDAAGNLKPDKANSQVKIDGIVALLMGLDRCMRREKPKKSAYEEDGLVVV
ncbi:MAG TPA: terminase TerL endonuclease subunit, partial [Anaerolineae bacterium]|nr:terminase TerL endonuclease subunit [Anaerolineae bacterium]